MLVIHRCLDDEFVTIWWKRQEFDVHHRHVGTLVKDLVRGAYETHAHFYGELIHLNKRDRQNAFKRKRDASR